ncbi:hypothetical protein AX17_003705 [Amanita inopinata Kibby_2008]|nr:hypothetical protein AX17_003705 [Amanita inopinata Kibby_2008]
MGQSNSRYQPPGDRSTTHDNRGPPTTSNFNPTTTQPTVEDGTSAFSDHTVTDTSSPSRPSRRSLLRRSLLSLVKPSSPTSGHERSLTSSSSHKRPWLSSRRWSKPHPSLAEEIGESSGSPHHDNPPTVLSTPVTEKGKEREEYMTNGVAEVQPPLPTDQQLTESNSLLPPPPTSPDADDTTGELPTTTTSLNTLQEQSLLALSPMSTTQLERDAQETHLSPLPTVAETPSPPPPAAPLSTSDETDNMSEGDSATIFATAAGPSTSMSPDEVAPASDEPSGGGTDAPLPSAPIQGPTRPFPPPGTLVVVQGVVHTTDVPRPSIGQNTPSPGFNADNVSTDQSRMRFTPHASRPVSQERNISARNRLSSLLRPRSASANVTSSPLADSIIPPVSGNEPGNVSSGGVSEAPDVARDGIHMSQEEGLRDVTCSASGSDDPSAAGSGSMRPTSADEAERQDMPAATSGSPHLDDGEQSITQRSSEDSTGGSAISSSSIDVLGTLLSVAAAATAASLLTGSSEPILPSSLSPSSNGNFGPPSPLMTNPSSGNGMTPPDFSGSGRAERMRNAWTSIRERLGIRPSGSSSSTSSVGNAGTSSTVQSAADTREMMLSEMARAFSVGLGLGGFSGGPTSNNPNVLASAAERPSTPEARALPTEGSFERFLMDLQADLRVALTTGEGGSGIRAMAAGSGWSDTRPDVTNGTQNQSTEEPSPTQDVVDEQRPENTRETEALQEDNQGNSPSSDDDVPELQEVSDSEEEDETEDDPRTPGEAENETHVDEAGERQRPNGPGRINWWRLYRFPAIGVPRNNPAASAAAAAALSNSTETTPATPLPVPNTSPVEAATDLPSLVAEAAAATASPNPSDPQTVEAEPQNNEESGDNANATNASGPQNSVVPVIIVGLQSVNMEWRQGGEGADGEANDNRTNDAASEFVDDGTDDIFGPPPDHELEELDNVNGTSHSASSVSMEGSEAENAQRRGRRWRSRAADAFRNLRPRRAGEQRNGAANGDVPHLQQQMPPMGPGSRMFLIYVIGGYYPPNHSIVLGNPADLESFEALSELAELLGQVKPPTATKEEIERSGLQVIKASLVPQYEREGKVASNCTERCLICLDEYIVEDDVRVMACRHAFHKDCVDKWLQTGKNNCPACRSRGVSTETLNPAAAAATSS